MWRASLGLSLLSLATQALQLGLQVVLARRYGSGPEVDAYVAAVTGPQLAVALLVAPCAHLALPALARAYRRGRGDYARLRDGVGLAVAGFAAALAGLACLAPGVWLALFAPGLAAPVAELARAHLPLAAAALVPGAVFGILCQAQHARARFALPALVGGAAATALLAVYFGFHERLGLRALLIGQLLGQGLACLALLAAELRVATARPRLRVPVATLRRAAWLAAPVVVVAVNVRISVAVDRHFASLLDGGSLALLYYAERWLTLSQAVLVMPVVTVLYTRLSRSDDAHAEIQPALATALFTGLPLAVASFVLAPDLARVLLAGAGGTPEAVPTLAACLRGYVGALALGAYGSMLVRIYYVRGDTRTPLWLAGLLPLGLNAGLDAWAAPRFGLPGIAAVTSGVSVFVLAALTAVLVRREPGCLGAPMGRSALRTGLGCLGLVAAGAAASALPAGLPRLVGFALLGPLGFLALAAAGGSVEARELLQALRPGLGRPPAALTGGRR